MPELDRRAFLKGAAIAPAAWATLRSRSQAAQFVFRYGNDVSENSPLNLRIRQAADRIQAATDGRFVLQIFPGGQLGSDVDMLSQLQSGAIDFYTASGIVLSTLVPLTEINALGFAFRDHGQVWSAMDGKLGDVIRSKIEAAGLHPIRRIFDIGFRQVTASTRPISDPDSFRGFKIRIAPSQLGVSMFKALDAEPTSLKSAEVYAALQTGAIDGQENLLSVIAAARLYEVQKYASMTNHIWDGFWMVCNGRAWNGLPEDIRQVVSQEFNRAAEEDRNDMAAIDSSLRDQLESKGMVFNVPDRARFRAALADAGYYEQWRRLVGGEAWDALESYVGRLD